jgi:hypothetical protein
LVEETVRSTAVGTFRISHFVKMYSERNVRDYAAGFDYTKISIDIYILADAVNLITFEWIAMIMGIFGPNFPDFRGFSRILTGHQ